jgi:porin
MARPERLLGAADAAPGRTPDHLVRRRIGALTGLYLSIGCQARALCDGNRCGDFDDLTRSGQAEMKRAMKVSTAAPVATALFALACPGPVHAQLLDVPATWGGDFSSRLRLTGDWGGLRDDLGKRGVVLDVDATATPQDVLSGGRSTGSETWANIDYTLNVDTDKLGLWPGGLVTLQADTGLGTNLFANSGALVPVNTASLVPAPNDHSTALLNATFMQFLSEQFGLVVGKFNTLDSGKQEFYGDYYTQFLNAAFVFPMTFEQVPISAYGGGLVGLPTKNSVLSLVALDPNGTPTSNSLHDTFDSGVMLVGSGQLTIKPFDLVGHQNVGFSWSNKERVSLEQDPSNLARLLLQTQFPRLADPGPILEQILARFFPGLIVPAAPANRESSSWSINYAFDQYLWQPPGDDKHGVGMFFSAGVSDGNPNPIKWAFLAGVGGKGVPGRANDSYGIGFARTEFSSAFVPYLRQGLGLGLNHEDAFETYYNLAVTAWFSMTADLQLVDPALKKRLDSSGTALANVSNSTIGGLRFRVRL